MKKLDRILRSANYKNGAFQNLSKTDVKAKGVTYFKMLRDSFNRPHNVKPLVPLPSVKTELKSIKAETPVIVWFGHSSYFMKVKETTILVDPVLSGHASPVPFMIRSFPGSDVYTVDDMPEIDMLILTHNHYDHLDIKTVLKLKEKVRSYYAPLGVGDLLEKTFLSEKRVTELDWWDTEKISPDISLTATPARHFSGRGFKRGGSLWTSFVLEVFGYNVFIGGDSGYDTHFKEIGERFGPFDIAILECGQYNTNWPMIHMMPEEVVQANIDLRSKMLLPVHWGKFALSTHAWNEPVKRVVQAAAAKDISVTTPMIGEPVVINEYYPQTRWWETAG